MTGNILEISYNGVGATLYVIIRKSSSQTVWNGSTMVTFSAVDLGTYDLPMTDSGGDFYTLTVPSALPADTYRFFYYLQSGGSPAATDLLLATEEAVWNGTSTSSVSTVTLSSFALTTLANCKTQIVDSTSSDDTLLTLLINGVSAYIERVVGVKFVARSWREWYNLNTQNRIVLNHRPVQWVNRAAYGAGLGLTINNTSSAINATAAVYRDPESADAGGLRLTSVNSSGVTVSTNLTFATYPSLTLLAAAVNAVSGWTATASRNIPSANLYPTGGQNALARTVNFYWPDVDIEDWRLDGNLSTLELNTFNSGWPLQNMQSWRSPDPRIDDYRRATPRGFQYLLVEYEAGFMTVPNDVEFECRRLVQDEFYRSKNDTTVFKQVVGPISETYLRENTNEIRERLAPYIDGANLIGGSVI